MKLNFCLLIPLILLLFYCKDDTEIRKAENLKEAKKKEVVFAIINKGWKFQTNALSQTVQGAVTNWSEWRLFLSELNQKPKSTIGAFQKKAKALSQKVMELNNTLPIQFAKPEIKSRIAVLTTKVNSLYLFINLQHIQEQKVLALIGEINLELASIYQQMEEINRKNSIPIEEGEADMIRMLDKSRAIPSPN